MTSASKSRETKLRVRLTYFMTPIWFSSYGLTSSVCVIVLRVSSYCTSIKISTQKCKISFPKTNSVIDCSNKISARYPTDCDNEQHTFIICTSVHNLLDLKLKLYYLPRKDIFRNIVLKPRLVVAVNMSLSVRRVLRLWNLWVILRLLWKVW